MFERFGSLFNIEGLIDAGGTIGILIIAGIVFAESGLLIGFFLPGDTLLFTAGFFAAQGHFNIIVLIIAIILAAIIGDNVGYSIGRRTGHRIFKKEDGIFFHKNHIIRAEKFYEKHGGKTIILARFVPAVRTFAPIVAGVGKMSRRRFMAYNIVGAVIWGTSVTLMGYWLGSKITNIEAVVLPAFALATMITFGPALYHLFKEKGNRERITQKFKLFLRNIFLNKKVD